MDSLLTASSRRFLLLYLSGGVWEREAQRVVGRPMVRCKILRQATVFCVCGSFQNLVIIHAAGLYSYLSTLAFSWESHTRLISASHDPSPRNRMQFLTS